MRLWLVEDFDRWGYSRAVVRADSAHRAIQLAVGPGAEENSRRTVTVLPSEGPEAVLWSEESSPDSQE